MKRLFIAVPISVELIKEILPLQEALRQTGVQASFVAAQNLHFTLVFLGDVREDLVIDIVDKIQDVVLDWRPFPLELKGVGLFEGRVTPVWIGVQGSQLLELMNEVQEKLVFIRKEDRESTPHLTIARIKWGTQKKELTKLMQRLQEREIGRMMVDRLVLFESRLTREGPVYSPIHEFLL